MDYQDISLNIICHSADICIRYVRAGECVFAYNRVLCVAASFTVKESIKKELKPHEIRSLIRLLHRGVVLSWVLMVVRKI